MKMKSAYLFLVGLLWLSYLVIPTPQILISVKKVTNNQWLLDRGSIHGVKVGFSGYLNTNIKSGGKQYSVKIAKFRVVKVELDKCFITLTSVSEGFFERDFQWAEFIDRLIPPPSKVKISPYNKMSQATPTFSTKKNIEWFLSQANAFMDKKKFTQAKIYYEKILEIDPLDPIAKEMIVECDRVLNASREERKFYDYLKRGDRYLSKNMIAYALEYYLTAYNLLPAKESEIAKKMEPISENFAPDWGKFIKKHPIKLKKLIETYFQKKAEIMNFDEFGIEWIEIPRGKFMMGNQDGDIDEKHKHEVYLDEYKISKNEITFSQYDEFCEKTGRKKPGDEGWGRGNRPVINVSWSDAKDFCVWLSEKSRIEIDLPTEAQWELAARGTDQRIYPWGNKSPDCSLVNYQPCESQTKPVGSYSLGLSPYGVQDMAGNVDEWCKDWYDPLYYHNSPSNNPQGPSLGQYHVVRGGSFKYYGYFLRSSNRDGHLPGDKTNSIGFRIVQNLK